MVEGPGMKHKYLQITQLLRFKYSASLKKIF